MNKSDGFATTRHDLLIIICLIAVIKGQDSFSTAPGAHGDHLTLSGELVTDCNSFNNIKACWRLEGHRCVNKRQVQLHGIATGIQTQWS
jgi:hypothetical protein